MAERRLAELVDLAAAGIPPDRFGADTEIAPADRPAVVALRTLTPLLRLVPPDQHRLLHLTAGWFGRIMAAALIVASLKIGAALIGALLPDEGPTTIPTAVFSLVVLVYGVMGLMLTVGGRWDERARSLGWLYLLTASFFCNRQITTLSSALGAPWSSGLMLLQRIPIDAVAPAAVWLFVARFPEAPAASRPQRLARVMTMIAAVIGVALVAANLAGSAGLSPVARWLAQLDHRGGQSLYYQAAFFTLLAVPFVLYAKAGLASGEERWRVRNFCAALALGFAPIVVATILRSPGSPLAHWFTRERTQDVGVVIFAGLLSVPFTTAWAVTVSRVLDVRFFARAAVKAAAAQATLAAITLVPFVLLVRQLYLRREQSLIAVATSPDARLLAALFGVGTMLTLLHARIVALANRWLLRQRPEAALAAARVAALARRSRSVRELAEVIAREIEVLYQPEAATLLILDPSGDAFCAAVGSCPRLPAASGLAYVLDSARDVLSVDPAGSGEFFHLLPGDEREWLRACRASWLVPVRGRDDRLTGLLVVGRRHGDLEFAPPDLRAIVAIAEAASLVLENFARQQDAADVDLDAVECGHCGQVTAAAEKAPYCAVCGGGLTAAPVPKVLAHKYRLEQRVGRGGMGTVYRAMDERLGRAVAIKALHDVDRTLVHILLAEARLTAGLDIPGVVRLFAIEEWRGVPLLVMECVGGGTLADRIRLAPLRADEAARAGLALARTLSALHAQHIAHRDVKPGNVGFRADGTPCLLDLGLAGDARVRPWEGDQVGGTPSYVAPFVLAGSSDYARGDTWSLCQTLIESLAGADSPAAVRLRHALADAREACLDAGASGLDLLVPLFEDYLRESPSPRP